MLGGVESRNLDELPGWARDLAESAPVARLGLLDDGDRPRVLPVTYAIDVGTIWSAIDRKPKRIGAPARLGWLRRRPDVAITVDHYADDWDLLAWVQVLGRAEVIAATDAPEALNALAEKYEPYREEAPPGPLIQIVPQRVLYWRASPL